VSVAGWIGLLATGLIRHSSFVKESDSGTTRPSNSK
jgi:hypothetical protein